MRKLSTSTFRYTKWSCYKFYSLFKYTIFSNTKIPLNDFFESHLLLASKCSFTSIQIITGHSTSTVAKHLKIIKNQIKKDISQVDTTIGGEGIMVHLDESKFGKRKYHQGHHVEGVWLFGGVEVTSERKFFCIKVEKR
ncbi:hypothetical protein H312_01695, partial [Anncaliia algerae PRA339]